MKLLIELLEFQAHFDASFLTFPDKSLMYLRILVLVIDLRPSAASTSNVFDQIFNLVSKTPGLQERDSAPVHLPGLKC